MITGSRALFEHLPVAFADPVSLAAQQAEGHLTLIVVCYPCGAPPAEHSSGDALPSSHYVHRPIHPPVPAVKPMPCYDVFVCKAPVVVTVAHLTPAFRFPISAARALHRYYAARDHRAEATLSLYELGHDLAGRFLETVYFQACLQLSLRYGQAGLPLEVVADQIRQTGCRSGVLELCDFSDPGRPRVTLFEMGSGQEAIHQVREQARTLRGQVLVYDRGRNQAVAADRGCETFDAEAVMAEATRYAERLRAGSRRVLGPLTRMQEATAARLASTPETEAAEQPMAPLHPAAQAATSPDDPLAGRMAALLAGRPSSLLGDLFSGDGAPPERLTVAGDGHAGEVPDLLDPKPRAHAEEAPVVDVSPSKRIPSQQTAPTRTPASDVPMPEHEEPEANPEAALQVALRGVVAAARDELTQHFGQEKADLLWHEAAKYARTALPVPAPESLSFLRALVTGRPPRRIMRFRKKMQGVQEALAADLHAVHGQFRHLGADHPLLLDLARLWSRCTYE